MSTGEIVETVIGAGTGLAFTAILCGREAVKRGWVRFSLALAVVPLEKRTGPPKASAEPVPAAQIRPAA